MFYLLAWSAVVVGDQVVGNTTLSGEIALALIGKPIDVRMILRKLSRLRVNEVFVFDKLGEELPLDFLNTLPVDAGDLIACEKAVSREGKKDLLLAWGWFEFSLSSLLAFILLHPLILPRAFV